MNRILSENSSVDIICPDSVLIIQSGLILFEKNERRFSFSSACLESLFILAGASGNFFITDGRIIFLM